ncbi:MAG: hypothetical protein Salg2KO_06860 [Salibacteraceae bacterium]
MDLVKKIWFPTVLTLSGILAVIIGLSTNQSGFFMLGSFALLISGAVAVVATTIDLSKPIRYGISAVLAVLIAVLAYADYQSIKVPIEFENEKERRYEHVVQRLKDIRTAELAYKAKYQKYQGNMDSLIDFIASDSLSVIKAFGEVPDTMTLEEAIAANVVQRDTILVPVIDSLFGVRHQKDRVHPFKLDSLRYVPFTNKGEFKLEAGTVDRSGTDVPVFMAEDGAPFDKSDPRKVGSMTDPKTNGNWE